MAAIFRASLNAPGANRPEDAVGVATFALQEGYSTGWGGTARVIASRQSGAMTAGMMFGSLMASGVRAGKPLSLRLAIHGGLNDGALVREWACVVESLQPIELDGTSAACDVQLLDPVSFLAGQPIWGAYRSVSAGSIVGGALSLAAGGDGKPTLSPQLPGFPVLRVVENFREALKAIPHAIAPGQPLGDWLAEFLALLGLRAELLRSDDGLELLLVLLDGTSSRQPLLMKVVSPHENGEGTQSGTDPSTSDSGGGPLGGPGGGGGGPLDGDGDLWGGFEDGSAPGDGKILVVGHTGFAGAPRRGGIIDDPTMGSSRAVYALGSIGSVLTGPGLDAEEAGQRIHKALLGTYAEMLMVSAVTGQPRIRIGDCLKLSASVHGQSIWQVAGVKHMLSAGAYDNDLTLLRGDIPWHPELPLHRAPVYVTGIVNGGNSYVVHEPVPRDHLGRVKVTFPFTPTAVGEEAAKIVAADTTQDGRIRMEDFSDSQIKSFTDDEEEWEEKVAKYKAGEFADPYPGRADDDLDPDELAEREELRAARKEALAYMAYEKASADRDFDGVISDRDTLISDELNEYLATEKGRKTMRSYLGESVADGEIESLEASVRSREASVRSVEEALEAQRARQEASKRQSPYWMSGSELENWRRGIEEEVARVEKELEAAEKELEAAKEELEAKKVLDEYNNLFDESETGLSEEQLDARKDAVDEADRWPPRIPLPVIAPMAGAKHGFVSGHRHGDICRIAVSNPLSAEIVGFQYREDRRINVDVAGALAGLVVEHDYSQTWSGLVFKRKKPDDANKPDDAGKDDDSQKDDDS